MFKKLNKKGFTLAELLVVVAIIGVLVAISIPIFTSQLEKARQATDMANLRASYAEAATASLQNDGGTGEGSDVTMVHTATGFTQNTGAKIGDIAVSTEPLSTCTKDDVLYAKVDATGNITFEKR